MRTQVSTIPLVLLVVVILGCAHQEKKSETTTPPTGVTAAQTAQNPGGTGLSSSEKTCNTDLDCGANQLCINQHCVDITPNLAECSTQRIHFDFNATEIHDTERPMLERMARCLKADRKLHVTVEGNADERGTEEYNLALGDRRATAVAKYLELLGVSQVQLKTVSYGKENPLCAEHDEECWSKNRRAALKPKENKR